MEGGSFTSMGNIANRDRADLERDKDVKNVQAPNQTAQQPQRNERADSADSSDRARSGTMTGSTGANERQGEREKQPVSA